MNSLLKSDIFFIITSISVVIILFFLVFIFLKLIKILKDIENVTGILNKGTNILKKDSSDFYNKIKKYIISFGDKFDKNLSENGIIGLGDFFSTLLKGKKRQKKNKNN